MEKLKIEKGIELPKKNTIRKSHIPKMEVGDSVLHDYPKTDFNRRAFQTKILNRYRAYSHKMADEKLKFASRCLEKGVRIWRIK